MEALDTLGRPLHDLRISVTDRCNFRCVYCMPKEVFGTRLPLPAACELLTFEEITRVAGMFVAHGVRKIRITGGEPLLRRDLERLIEMLAALDRSTLTLTTNGSLLARRRRRSRCRPAARDRQPRLARRRDVPRNERRRLPGRRVLEGIDAAAAAGLPVKVNAVVKRGINDEQIVPMARHFKGAAICASSNTWTSGTRTAGGWTMSCRRRDRGAASTELRLEPVDPGYRGEVAQRWRYRDGSGEVGVITSVTQPFCGDCTRARLSAEGKVYTCLFAVRGTDLRALVRGGATDDELADAVRGIWSVRTDRYSDLRSAATDDLQKVEMSYIGG